MAQYPSTMALSTLDETTGYTFRSGVAGAYFGVSVAAAGDVNGDGHTDYLIGESDFHARSLVAQAPTLAGQTYLVFGGASLDALEAADGVDGVVDLSLMSASQGYRISLGTVADGSGTSVAGLGNIDGVAGDDFIIGTPFQATGVPGNAHMLSGGANLALLDAADGTTDGLISLGNVDDASAYRFVGAFNGDRAGISVSRAPDLNGDGVGDILIGGYLADPTGFTNGGEVALVFGDAANLAAADGNGDHSINISSLNGVTGYRLQGGVAQDFAGVSVAGVRDVDGDGVGDILIGAQNGTAVGSAYIVFGGASNLEDLDDGGVDGDGLIDLTHVNGTTGFRFAATVDGDQHGWAVSGAGDVNGDGFEDLLIGDPFSDVLSNNGGDAYLVFGGMANLSALDAEDGSADGSIDVGEIPGAYGFRFQGPGGQWAGHAVSSGGDVDGDGFDDIVVASNFRDGRTGAVFVVFGGADGASGFDLADAADGVADGVANTESIAGSNGGFRIDGVEDFDQAGFAVAGVGDVTGDGLDDIMLSSVRDQVTTTGGVAIDSPQSGEVYLLFSRLPDAAVTRTGSDIGQQIVGGDFADTLYGAGGDDVLIGNGAGDRLYGGLGSDTASYRTAESGLIVRLTSSGLNTGDAAGDSYSSIENIVGGAFVDTLVGDNAANVIDGGAGNDLIYGAGGADTLFGAAGSDKLIGGLGADRMEGGAGDDVYYYDDVGDSIVETSAGDSADAVSSSLDFALNNAGLQFVENVMLSGTGDIDASGNSAGNKINGNYGANELAGEGGNDQLFGGAGLDTLTGGLGNDRLDGGADADGLSGGDGVDSLLGQAGDDSLFGGAGNDRLDGGLGADDMQGGAGNDVYVVDDAGDAVVESLLGDGIDSVLSAVDFDLSAPGRDFVENVTLTGAGSTDATGNGLANRLVGNGGVNTLAGGDGNDTLDGMGGADTMAGGAGNDTMMVGSSGDVVEESLGGGTADRVISTVDFSLAAGVEVEFLVAKSGAGGLELSGNELANRVYGYNGEDTLSGGVGSDKLYGGGGNDVLTGGAGMDVLDGGAGDDVFVYEALTDSAPNAQRDQIFNFAEGDLIDLTAIDADTGTGGHQAFAFIGTGAFTAAGQVRFSTAGGTTTIEANVDAGLAADMQIALRNGFTPDGGDFILI